VYGDGPERPQVLAAIAREGLDGVVVAPGFVDAAVVDAALRRVLCMVLPSRREGYGMIVVEAAACGTPSVVAAEPDNAAVELVDEGENGIIAASARPTDLAEAIVRVHEAGAALRETTAAWFERNSRRLSLEASLETVSEAYRETVDQ
jgi:glycosyltransferase involved in cell wall biosynthesis